MPFRYVFKVYALPYTRCARIAAGIAFSALALLAGRHKRVFHIVLAQNEKLVLTAFGKFCDIK